MARHASCRRAFSLLEMILALSILGTSLAILAQIADTGVDAAREARALASARMICQTKLNEQLLNMQSGMTPVAVMDAQAEPFDSAATETFTYSVEVQPGQLDGLLALRITVNAYASGGSVLLVSYAVDRWVIDPMLGLEEAEMEEQAAREELTGGDEEENT